MNPYLLALIVVVNLAIWTHFDASRLRDAHHISVGPKNLPPHSWASLVLMLAPLAFPYYLAARSEAARMPLRDGPPPVFTARDLNAWGYLTGISFFLLSVFLLFTGQTVYGALAGLGVVAGLFGGRRSVQERAEGARSFDLGRAAWDMQGFKPMQNDDFDDDAQDEAAAPTYEIPSREPTQPAPAAGGVDVFAPLAADNRSGPPGAPPVQPAAPEPRAAAVWSEPVSGVFDGELVAEAARPVAMAVSDDDVWDPVRADEEARKAAERQAAAAGAPAATPQQSPPPALPPVPQPARAATPPTPTDGPFDDDELAPFQLGSDDDVPVAEPAEPEEEEDLSHLLPLPPMVTGSRPRPPAAGAPRAAVPQAAAPPARDAAATAPPAATRRAAPLSTPSSAPAGAPARTPQRPPTRSVAIPPGAFGAPVGGQPVSYAGASKSSGRPAALLWFVAIGVALGLAWAYSRTDTDAPPVDRSVDASDAVDQSARAAATPSDAEIAARAKEESLRRRMSEWISSYDAAMRPIAALVEEIDFGRLGTGGCLELQRKAKQAGLTVDKAPDEEVEALLRPAFEAFVEASKACAVSAEREWSINLLQAKDHTHETQVLLDERYRYVGPYELEQEEALGQSRSTESISGRYLAGEL